MWPGVAPERDSFNETYITQAANLIQDAYNNYNISSLVDCHQDVLSEAVCGEGAPLWATQPLDWNFPLPLAAPYATNNHIPTREECLSITWSTYYVAEATCSAFQRLYQNYDGLTEKFADYWGKLASSFKSIPGIVGMRSYIGSIAVYVHVYEHHTHHLTMSII